MLKYEIMYYKALCWLLDYLNVIMFLSIACFLLFQMVATHEPYLGWVFFLFCIIGALYFDLNKIRKGSTVSIAKEIENKKFEELHGLDLDTIGFKLQRIVEFVFEPNGALFHYLAGIIKIDANECEKVITDTAQQLKITFINYSNDLGIIKKTFIRNRKPALYLEDIDFPKPKDYPREIDIDYFDLADDILLYCPLGDKPQCQSVLFIGYLHSPAEINVFLSTTDEDDKVTIHKLGKIPFYGAQLEKYDSLQLDKGNHRKDIYRAYSNGISIEELKQWGFSWSLCIAEHEYLVKYRKKIEECKNENCRKVEG